MWVGSTHRKRDLLLRQGAGFRKFFSAGRYLFTVLNSDLLFRPRSVISAVTELLLKFIEFEFQISMVSQLNRSSARRMFDTVLLCGAAQMMSGELPGGIFLLTEQSQLSFLANVNSRSRLLYAIARPSVVCLSSVSVVCNVRAPYSGCSNFRQFFYGVWHLGHPVTCTENVIEIIPGEPFRRGS